MPLMLNLAEPLVDGLVAWWHRSTEDGPSATEWMDLAAMRIGNLLGGSNKHAESHSGCGNGSVQFVESESDSYVFVPADVALVPQQLTVAHWVRMDALSLADDGIWGCCNSGHTVGYSARLDGSLDYEVQIEGTVVVSPITLDVWTFLTVTYDGATIALYANGVSQDTAAYAGGITTGNVLHIGRDDAPGFSMLGFQDDWMLWSRALESGDVAALYTDALACWDGYFSEEMPDLSGVVLYMPPFRPRRRP
jgi:hypothetical protein